MLKRNRKLRLSLLVFLVSVLFYAASTYKIPVADHLVDNYFSVSIQAATLAYATTRGVNAVVSVIKESELNLAPAGVGITIAAGQILDPINDLAERLSSLLVAAIASLGIQKIGYEIGMLLSFKAIAIVLLLTIPLIWIQHRIIRILLNLGLRACIVLLLLRFMLPATAWVSASFYENWLQPSMNSSLQKLTVVSSRYDDMSSLPSTLSDGFLSSLTNNASEKVEKVKAALLNMVENAENIISSLLNLMIVYLAMFVVQVLLLPLLMLWLLVALLKSTTFDAFTSATSDMLLSFLHKPLPQ